MLWVFNIEEDSPSLASPSRRPPRVPGVSKVNKPSAFHRPSLSANLQGEELYEALTNTHQYISINLHKTSDATLTITMRQAFSLLKATDGFSVANLIGMGGFSSVYKGILDEGENFVAVKVLNLQLHGASKSFFAECEAFKNIKHWNLVKVLTTCSSVDFKGKALIYEFMINWSLEEWLHPKENMDGAYQESRSLNLLHRLNTVIACQRLIIFTITAMNQLFTVI
ncbi:leucine-rich repeat protein kinase family protein [Actinidia rufa]|uniref:Leucine-rich repeat protein kinase family protein n=1 Tax=Actinidia rufa TaxID=165716 RepID=A0A7J0DR52_9ERIC|nr:leucine-rich repeat protein kinase family protein [Actinidia rufa]